MEIKDIDSIKPVRIILSGGGTAGHIYPAVAIAEKLKSYYDKDIDIIFVGAKGKMEMEKISELGYDIIGLPISGFLRRFTLKNLALPFKVIFSVYLSKRIIKKFKPQVVFGFGGYASAPIIRAAQRNKVATMIWEGNSFAGMANRMLSKSVQKVFVSYDNMDRFFAKQKIVLSGNPLRADMYSVVRNLPEAYSYFGIDSTKPTLLVTGGSLGTRVFNEGMMKFIDKIIEQDSYNVIWQTGSYYYDEMISRIGEREHKNIWIAPFIKRMDYAYSVADLTIARAGASTISELALVGMASIIVPSPNVADDHQRKNAISLVDSEAAILIEDNQAVNCMIPEVERVIFNGEKLVNLRKNILNFAQRKSADIILNELKKFVIV